MDEPAEPVAATNRGLLSLAERDDLQRSGGRSQPERAVWALAVVVVDVLSQEALELAPAEYEQPVEALLPQGADETLGVRVGVRGPERRPDDRNPLGLEDFVEASTELRIAVVDQEAQRTLPAAAVDHEVARLLRNPCPTRILGAARKPDSAALKLDEEQHVEPVGFKNSAPPSRRPRVLME